MKIILLVFFCLLAPSVVHAQGTLVLLIDGSASLSLEDLDSQLDSYSNVLRSVPHLENIQIEAILFEDNSFHLASGNAFEVAAMMDAHERTPVRERGLTCLNLALEYVLTLIPELPQPVVLDISGDGESNCSEISRIHELLDLIEDTGTIVNTLYYNNIEAVVPDRIGAITFYQELTRNFGFSMTVSTIDNFETALRNKIVLEVADLQ